MTDLERMVAMEAIKQLKARYFRCMDSKDWAGLLTVFMPDVRFDASQALFGPDPVTGEPMPTGIEMGGVDLVDAPGPVAWPLVGAVTVRDYIKGSLLTVTSVHLGYMPEIEVTSATTARGIWGMGDVLRWTEAGPVKTLTGFGHYHETYRRVDGQWRIETLYISRLRVDLT